MNYRPEILSDLKSHLLKNFGKSVKEVILFGSRLEEHSNDYSDYDVLIILDEDYDSTDENKILDLCYDIDLKYNILLDVHILSKKELALPRGKQPVFTNAINSGIYA
ncbi:Nucleotidyltransferase domain-containing protein [Tangfeifania diversioriginum]|uniref:Nucleotidyltransferase domain-containing protein n=1 Tax=Tangfeifania diversioriginum TaxID=1168035 RepID=A0A1M6AWS1_9BACT|nr:nucleotidyltransferase domain-containing protein [Tangfeifania diversioriginum]SHI40663.1 Nucleotidyltransferase domain-containing protein [Tangfeifania diversioriginum]